MSDTVNSKPDNSINGVIEAILDRVAGVNLGSSLSPELDGLEGDFYPNSTLEISTIQGRDNKKFHFLKGELKLDNREGIKTSLLVGDEPTRDFEGTVFQVFCLDNVEALRVFPSEQRVNLSFPVKCRIAKDSTKCYMNIIRKF